MGYVQLLGAGVSVLIVSYLLAEDGSFLLTEASDNLIL